MSSAWVQTFTCVCFDLLDPNPRAVRFRDIAHALANSCRFNGHCDRFYSVAEHSIVMSRLVPPEMAEWALLHDATEAYVGDMVRPLKEVLPEFRRIEDGIAAVIAQRFKLGPRPVELRGYDMRMLATERAQLMVESPNEWPSLRGFEPFDVKLEGWSPREAEGRFYSRFGEILGEKYLREEAA